MTQIPIRVELRPFTDLERIKSKMFDEVIQYYQEYLKEENIDIDDPSYREAMRDNEQETIYDVNLSHLGGSEEPNIVEAYRVQFAVPVGDTV